jgi:D-alanine-D-alanine ligase
MPGLCVVKKLESEKRIFTGCSSNNYLWPKEKIKQFNVASPKYVLLNKNNFNNNLEMVKSLNFPIIIKPNTNTGGSTGIFKDSVIRSPSDINVDRIRDLLNVYEQLIVEEYIAGKEVTVLICQNVNITENPIVLEPVECIFSGDSKFKYYDLKWKENTVVYEPVKDIKLNDKIMEFAKSAFVTLKLDNYVRFDIRIDEHDNLYLIDVNPYCAVYYSPQNYGCADFILKNSKIMDHLHFFLHTVACANYRYDLPAQ